MQQYYQAPVGINAAGGFVQGLSLHARGGCPLACLYRRRLLAAKLVEQYSTNHCAGLRFWQVTSILTNLPHSFAPACRL
jgi:hypothetical protein